jgi:hypothetical protein
VTSADVLEALHGATGMPIVADYYTRLYPPSPLIVRDLPLCDALNHLAGTMGLRWAEDSQGDWLQFRSVSFFNDRLKEVPNRLLSRWAAARRQHRALRLEDLVEIAQLPDAQLNGAQMAEGARLLFGLAEWDLARGANLRPHLRYLAGFTPAQQQQAMSDAGLPLAKMPLAQQQQFITFALGLSETPLQSLEELAGSTLRVEYTLPGGFQWGNPAGAGYTQWVVPLGPGPQSKRVPRPPVKERTREAVVQALRRVDPGIREKVLQLVRQADPRLKAVPPSEEEQIFPTRLNLTVIYIPGDTSARTIRVIDPGNDLALAG